MPQSSYTASPQFMIYSRTQHSRARGDALCRSVRRRGRKRRDASRYSTLSRNVTILPANRPYPYPDHVFSPDTIELARKPRNWRKSYISPSKRGFGKYLGNISSLLFLNPPFRSLTTHPLLSYRSRQPTALFCDLRTRPGPEAELQIRALGRSANTLDFFQLATSPPTQRLLIWHRKLPWKIKIESNSMIGITIQDVLAGIYEQLRYSIAHDDFYTVGLISEDREMISEVFHARCDGDPSEILGGVRRIDFLGKEFCFVGLSRSRNGTWEMKTAMPERKRMTLD
ncbi:hypothetical protein CPB84DRAFT_1779759 [Gymnopilus junonius]|uniref:DUF6699 domain-containing protein n=1 Tax=Gymnopilus junonius TaxID=109634 RepID=A0A9P5NQ03_GYMJU|nr:hypothetical protein CPB84DRAFT_1779759 [Gymnopilus junonius]